MPGKRGRRLEDAAAYLDLLEQSIDGLDIRDEKKFTEDVSRLFAASDVEASEDLQLLTIHKAKGLEFDTVILPGLGRRTRTDDPHLLNVARIHGWRSVPAVTSTDT